MNSWGRIFRLSVFGESHGPQLGIVLDGVPPGIAIAPEDFEGDLQRRRAGAVGTTTRKETDIPRLVSGWFEGKTTGAPLTIVFENNDVRSSDYNQMRGIMRPGHADFTAHEKFLGFQDFRGGGHFSGRLTVLLTAAGVVAKRILTPIEINARLQEAGGEQDIEQALTKARNAGDSIGGIISCSAVGIPAGWGEPFFDSVESQIAHLVFSVPAVKGIEFGSGFAAAKMFGSDHNDTYTDVGGETKTNYAGGINGGITNGNTLQFRVAFKPTSSTPKPQESFNFKTKKTELLTVGGRHDLCIAIRAAVVIEAVTAIALADLFLLRKKDFA